MVIDVDNREGFTDRGTNKPVTQKEIEVALATKEKVFVSFFGGPLVEVVELEVKTEYFSSFTDK